MSTQPFYLDPVATQAYPDSAAETPYNATADAGEFLSTLLDIVNPLQHIPLVSNVYREITGDEINPAARMVGGAVFGGPLGFASAAANVLIEQASGEDLFGHAVAMFTGGDEPVPVHAAAPTPDAATQSAVAPQSAPENVEIAWAGERVLPLRARDEFLAQNQPPRRPGAATPDRSGAPVAAPLTADARPASASPAPVLLADAEPDPAPTSGSDDTTGDAAVVEALMNGARPAWIDDALSAAQQNHSARNTGRAGDQPAQPWAANAMMQALDKYEAMTRARAAADVPSGAQAAYDERS